MSKTIQVLCSNQPKVNEKNKNIGLMIYCGKCKTGRCFNISSALKDLMEAKTLSEFSINTECEKCGNKIGVGISWINAEKAEYSYRFLPKENSANPFIVKDNNGLAKLHD